MRGGRAGRVGVGREPSACGADLTEISAVAGRVQGRTGARAGASAGGADLGSMRELDVCTQTWGVSDGLGVCRQTLGSVRELKSPGICTSPRSFLNVRASRPRPARASADP